MEFALHFARIGKKKKKKEIESKLGWEKELFFHAEASQEASQGEENGTGRV